MSGMWRNFQEREAIKTQELIDRHQAKRENKGASLKPGKEYTRKWWLAPVVTGLVMGPVLGASRMMNLIEGYDSWSTNDHISTMVADAVIWFGIALGVTALFKEWNNRKAGKQ